MGGTSFITKFDSQYAGHVGTSDIEDTAPGPAKTEEYHMNDTILIEDRGAIRTLTMNRPTKLNAMNTELVDTLTAASAPPMPMTTSRW